MKYTRKLVALVWLIGTGASLHALDWGVNVNEVPLVILGETSLYVESLKTSVWAYQPIFGADVRLQGDGSFSASSSGGAWTMGLPSFDLSEASIKGSSPVGGGAVVEWNAGRRNVNDATGGWILSSRWDGAGLSRVEGSVSVAGSAGYSGFLSKKTSKIAGSEADVKDASDPNVAGAPQRVYGAVSLGMNELFFRQDAQIEVLGSYDLRSGTGAVHGVYMTLASSGPLPGGLRQSFFATGALRATPATTTGGYITGVEISATLPFLGSRLVTSATASHGLGGHGFQAVSGKGLSEVVDLSTANGAAITADFSLKPLPQTALGLKGAALFRTSADPVVLPGFDSSSSASWLGAEAGLYASWTPTSDSSFGLNTGIFLPQAGAFVANTAPTVLAVVTATIKL